MLKTLRASLSIVLLIAALAAAPALALPPSERQGGGGRPAAGPSGPADLFGDLWGLVARLFSGSEADNRLTIDPNGASAQTKSRITFDPDGVNAGPAAESRRTFNPSR